MGSNGGDVRATDISTHSCRPRRAWLKCAYAALDFLLRTTAISGEARLA